MLQYSDANAKLDKLYDADNVQQWLDFGRFQAKVYSLELLSGWSCPHAKTCHSKVVELDGQYTKSGNPKRKLIDGKHTKFRCFSASQEALLPNVYDRRKNNFDLLRRAGTIEAMTALMQKAIPRNAGIIRQHVGGDFFSRKYFVAWLELARNNPEILFYAYTKSLNYWVENMQYVEALPNVILTASRGGSLDFLINKHGLRESVVVYSEEQADTLGLPIDHDDSHAATNGGNFALLLHGVQPKGSEAAKALVELRGKGSYRRAKNGAR